MAFRVRLGDLARTRVGWFFYWARQVVYISHMWLLGKLPAFNDRVEKF